MYNAVYNILCIVHVCTAGGVQYGNDCCVIINNYLFQFVVIRIKNFEKLSEVPIVMKNEFLVIKRIS